MKKLSSWISCVLLLLLVFTALRLTLLGTTSESSSNLEELYRGTVAKEFIEGPKMPFWDYMADEYCGGSLVLGILAIPLFYVLGPSLFSLKLAAFLFSFSTLGLLIFFMQHYFGKTASLMAAVLFIFSPPALTQLSLLATGDHGESLFFSMMLMLFYYPFLFGTKNQIFFLLLFGWVSGFGTGFAQITFVTVLACLGSWLILEPRSFFGLKIFVFGAGFLLGLFPWLLFNALHQFSGLRFILGSLFPSSGGAGTPVFLYPPLKIVPLLAKAIPLSFSFPPIFRLPGWTLGYLYYGLVVFSSLLLVKDACQNRETHHGEARRILPLVLYPIFFILLYSLSNFSVSYGSFREMRYFSPLHFFFILLLAAGLSTSKKKFILVMPLIILGLIGQGSIFFREPLGNALHYKGYSYIRLGERWQESLFSFPEKIEDFSKMAQRFNPEERRYFYLSLARQDCKSQTPSRSQVDALMKHVPETYRTYFWEGLGSLFSCRIEEGKKEMAQLESLIPQKDRQFFYKGIFEHPRAEQISETFLQNLDPEYRPWLDAGLGKAAFHAHNNPKHYQDAWFYRGLGQSAAYALLWPPATWNGIQRQSATAIPEKYQPEVAWGIGWENRKIFFEDRKRGLDHMTKLPFELRASALKGFEACGEWYLIS